MPWRTDNVFGDEYWESEVPPPPVTDEDFAALPILIVKTSFDVPQGRAYLCDVDMVTIPGDELSWDTREETVSLAVESARRWARRTDLSPELRLRRIWTVLETALR